MRAGLRLLGLRAIARVLPSTRSARSTATRPRLLLIRPDHLGDVLLTSPAIAALRQAVPHSRLTLLVGSGSAEVARRGAAVDEILTCDFPGFTRRSKRHPIDPYLLLLREAGRLRGWYDLAVVVRPDHGWGALLG